MNDYWIWTIHIPRWRYARDLGIKLIDITVKSGIKEFAPDIENLYKYKSGIMDMSEYGYLYNKKMIESYEKNIEKWRELEQYRNIAFACYCGPGCFCHRYLFANLFVNHLQQNNKRVIYQGELIPHLQNRQFYYKEK